MNRIVHAFCVSLVFVTCVLAAPLESRLQSFDWGGVKISKSAYSEPKYDDVLDTSRPPIEISKYTGGGLIPALLEFAVNNRKIVVHKHKFPQVFGARTDAFSAKAKILDLEALQSVVNRGVLGISFFGDRFKAGSAARLEIEVSRYGFQSFSPEKNQNPVMFAYVWIDVSIALPGEKPIKLGRYSGLSYSGVMFNDCLSDPKSVSAAYSEAVESARDLIVKMLGAKYGGIPY